MLASAGIKRGLLGLIALLLVAGCTSFQPKPLSARQVAADIAKRSLGDPDLRVFLERYLEQPLPAWPLRSWDFSELTLAALYYHPDLEIARAQWERAQAKVITAGAYPNPALSMTPGFNFDAEHGIPPELFGVTPDFLFITAGKRSYRLAAAQARAEALRFKLRSTAWGVRGRLRRTLFDLYLARQILMRQQRRGRYAHGLFTAIAQRFDAGAIGFVELIRARSVWTHARLSVEDARKRHTHTRAALAEAIGVTEAALNPINIAFNNLQQLPRPSELPDAQLRRYALIERADVRAALMNYAASQQALQLEIARQYPNIHLGPGYAFDDGQNKFTLGLAIELPIFNQNQGPIAEARANRRELAARLLALQAHLISTLEGIADVYRAARHKAELANRLAAGSQSQLASTKDLFMAGQTDRVAMLRARLQAESDLLIATRARVDAQQALSNLENVLQRPLTSAGAIPAWNGAEQTGGNVARPAGIDKRKEQSW